MKQASDTSWKPQGLSASACKVGTTATSNEDDVYGSFEAIIISTRCGERTMGFVSEFQMSIACVEEDRASEPQAMSHMKWRTNMCGTCAI